MHNCMRIQPRVIQICTLLCWRYESKNNIILKNRMMDSETMILEIPSLNKWFVKFYCSIMKIHHSYFCISISVLCVTMCHSISCELQIYNKQRWWICFMMLHISQSYKPTHECMLFVSKINFAKLSILMMPCISKLYLYDKGQRISFQRNARRN